jgi:hypothetical protein
MEKRGNFRSIYTLMVTSRIDMKRIFDLQLAFKNSFQELSLRGQEVVTGPAGPC